MREKSGIQAMPSDYSSLELALNMPPSVLPCSSFADACGRNILAENFRRHVAAD